MKNHVSRLAKIIYATKRTFETIQHVTDIFFQPAKIASSGFWNEWTRAESLRRKSKNSIYIEYLTIVFRFLRPRLIAVHHCSICVEPIILHRDTEYSDLCPNGRDENDHQNLYISKRTLWWIITEISNSKLDRYRIRIWCETIVYVNRNICFNGLISFCF